MWLHLNVSSSSQNDAKTFQNPKIYFIFSKNMYFWENYDSLKKILVKKFICFFAILTFLMAALDAQQNFMPRKYILFLSIFVRSKVYIFFL